MSGQDRNFQPIGLAEFYGGWSSDLFIGSTAQFYESHRIDFRKKPSSMTPLPQPRLASGGVVTDLVLAMDQTNSGTKYGVGDAGNVYLVSTSQVWSNIGNIAQAGGAGVYYRSDVDMLYMTGQTKVARINRTSSGAGFQPDWFSYGASTCTTCTKQGGINSYSVPTAISENSSNKRPFTSDIEPLYQIGVDIISKGSGNWTLTLHDDANNVLDAVTVSNATLTSGQMNYFVFSSPIRIQRGDNGGGSALTYHFHLTSTATDGTIMTTTVNSMVDCDMQLWAYALVPTNNGLHPMAQLSNLTLIGNGRYLAAYEPLQDNPTTSDFIRHRLTLPPGFEVTGIAQKNLMAVIAAERRSTTGDFQEGALFFWDGLATTYNDYWPVPEGSPEAIFSHKNVVYYIAGGALYRMRGGDQPIKIRTFRNTDSEYSNVTDTTHVYPNTMTVRRGILLMGYPSVTTNLSIEHGVYSLGAVTNEYPESFGYSYTPSTSSMLNTGTNNLRIGLVKSYGDILYTSWRDDSSLTQKYGVDIVDNTSTSSLTADWTSLAFDNNEPSKYNNAGYIIATFEPLPVGATVRIKYKIDSGDWIYSSYAGTGDSYLICPIDKRFLSTQFGLDITATTLAPEISSCYMWIDTLPTERPIGG